jgi:YVTN family beta-propeller protein
MRKRFSATLVAVSVVIGAAALPARSAQADDWPSVVATITVGTAPWGVAFSPDGSRAYVGNSGSGSISVIDVMSRAEIARPSGGARPAGVAVTPDGSSVLIADYGIWSMLFMDPADLNAPISDQSLSGCVGPLAVAMRDDGAAAYVGCSDDGRIREISIPGRVVTSLREPGLQGSYVRDIAYVSKGSKARDDFAYLLNVTQNPNQADFGPLGGYFRLHHSATNIALPGYGLSLAVDRRGTLAYVGDQSGNLSIIGIAADGSGSVLHTLQIGGELGGVALSPDEKTAYVTDRVGNTLSIVDVAIRTVTYSVAVGASALRVAVSPDGRTVLVTNNGTDTVSVIDVPQVTTASTAVGSRLMLECEAEMVVGATVACSVSGADPSIEILWRAAYNPPFAGAGVTLDGSGSGTFSFVVPAAALGQVVTVELVDWLAPVSLGIVGGPVPTSVPSGGGPMPVTLPALLAMLLVMSVGLAARHRTRSGSFRGSKETERG